jgi:hypothetical protein
MPIGAAIPARQPLRWLERPVAPATRDRLRVLNTAAVAFDAAPTTVALPDLSAFPTPKAKAERLLQAAAAVEHALMVQYLYVGYSLPGRGADIVGIAVEEMSHLMTVQNSALDRLGARSRPARFRASGPRRGKALSLHALVGAGQQCLACQICRCRVPRQPACNDSPASSRDFIDG